MRVALLSAAFLLAGCAAPRIPESEQVRAPRPCVSRAPLPPSERLEGREYAISVADEEKEDVSELLRLALPDGAWTSGTQLELGPAMLRVTQTPTVHERIEAIVGGVAAARTAGERFDIEVRVFDLAWTTAETLGPLERAAGSGNAPPFLRAPLARPALGRLDAAGGLQIFASLTAVPGRWVAFTSERSRTSAQGLGFALSEPPAKVTPVVLRTTTTGLVVKAVAAPARDGQTLVAFKVADVVPLGGPAIVARAYGGNTEAPVEVPGWVERRAEDAVLLAPGQSLALLGSSARADRARLIVITPVAWRPAAAIISGR
jgi:hypothetical protein